MFVLGSPSFYARFGFAAASDFGIESPYTNAGVPSRSVRGQWTHAGARERCSTRACSSSSSRSSEPGAAPRRSARPLPLPPPPGPLLSSPPPPGPLLSDSDGSGVSIPPSSSDGVGAGVCRGLGEALGVGDGLRGRRRGRGRADRRRRARAGLTTTDGLGVVPALPFAHEVGEAADGERPDDRDRHDRRRREAAGRRFPSWPSTRRGAPTTRRPDRARRRSPAWMRAARSTGGWNAAPEA